MPIYLGLRDSIMRYVNMLSEKYGCNFGFPARQGKLETVLHGCTLLFTPDFFHWYHGFYKRTFLYGEEGILYLMCKCRNLRQIYVPEVKIKRISHPWWVFKMIGKLSANMPSKVKNMLFYGHWDIKSFVCFQLNNTEWIFSLQAIDGR